MHGRGPFQIFLAVVTMTGCGGTRFVPVLITILAARWSVPVPAVGAHRNVCRDEDRGR